MIAPGEALPDVRVWIAPGEPVALRELPRDGPFLLLFYLLDWSAT